jgi:hypothetical protein
MKAPGQEFWQCSTLPFFMLCVHLRKRAFDMPVKHKKKPPGGGLNSCDPEGTRTPDPQIRNLLLYPAELRDHLCFFKIQGANLQKKEEFLPKIMQIAEIGSLACLVGSPGHA